MEGGESETAVPMDTGGEVSPQPGLPEEHRYCKHFPSNVETMDTCNSHQQPEDSLVSTSPTLTALDKTQDNFEALLLCLLQAYTTLNQPGNLSILGGAPISGAALDTLSSEQITALITSNSVNYEVIQQILAQQKSRPWRDGMGLLGSPNQEQNRSLTLNLAEMEDSSSSPTSLLSPMTADANQQLQQLIQITPQQLKILQSQVNELLQSQHTALPSDLSPQQQQQLIQTLLLRQLHLQQSGGGGSISLKDASLSMNQLLKRKDMGGGVTEVMSPVDATRPSGGSRGIAKEADGGVAKGTQPKKAASKPGTLSGATISSYQASVGRGRGKRGTARTGGRGGAKSAGPGRKKKELHELLQSSSDPQKVPLPYHLFFSEVYSTVMATNPKMGFSDASRIISTMWSAMGTDVKKRYYDEHNKLKAQQESDEDKQSHEEKKSSDRGCTMRSLIAAAPSSSTEGSSVVTVENTAPVSMETQTSIIGQVPNSIPKQRMRDISLCTATVEGKDPKVCVNQDCQNLAAFVENRGPRYCSNGCVLNHCRKVFELYFSSQV